MNDTTTLVCEKYLLPINDKGFHLANIDQKKYRSMMMLLTNKVY